MNPRRRHYVFAHRAIPQIVAAHGERFVEDMRGPHAASLLARLWDEIGGEPMDAPTVAVKELKGGAPFVLITMPEPENTPEAYYVGVVDGRCFTLERGVTTTGETQTFLCEWADGKHVNYGPGPPAEEHAFAGAVEKLR